MFRKFMMVLVGLALIPGLCFAEFYKYRDANGVLRFTDNLQEVPPAQRPAVQSYQETVTPEETREPLEGAEKPDLNVRAQQLNEERDSLAKEFAELEKERQAIEAVTREPQNDAEYEAYKTRVDTFNQRIKAYEVNRQIFQTKVDAFNQDAKNQ